MNTQWNPLPGSQTLTLACPCNHILHHGTRGPGKTAGQIAKFGIYVNQGYGPFWRGVIFGRSYKNLDDIVSKSRQILPKLAPGGRFLSAQSDLKWVWQTGEELLFRHMKNRRDYEQYHGQEFPFIGWNELTMYPTGEVYELMTSCNRSGFIPLDHGVGITKADRDRIQEAEFLGVELPEELRRRIPKDIPLITISTTNPLGPGHNWVKRLFIDAAPPGVPVIKTLRVFNPRTQQEEEVKISQVHVFGSYRENKYLAPVYIAGLHAIQDENKRKAWLFGDWSAVGGGAISDFWDEKTHVVPRFKVPENWTLDRSFDWGSSHPFSVGFWATANGEEVTLPDGRKFCPVKGSLIRIAELYGVENTTDAMGNIVPAYGTNKGVGWEARRVAREALAVQAKLLEQGWISGTIQPGPADGQIFAVNEKESGSIAAKMEAEGLEFFAADKSKGSRKNGLELFKGALKASVSGEGPGFYVMDNCKAFLATVPTIPRDEDDPDDVDTEAEDHVYDETRYRILSEKPQWAKDVPAVLAY